MEAKFALNRQEYWQYVAYSRKQAYKSYKPIWELRLLYWIYKIIFIVLGTYSMMKYFRPKDPLVAIFYFGCSYSFYYLICLLNQVSTERDTESYTKQLPRDSGPVLGERTLSIDPEGIRWKSSSEDGRQAWSAVINIVEHQNLILLFTESYSAHVVPARAFETKEDFASFFSLSLEYWRSFQPSARSATES